MQKRFHTNVFLSPFNLNIYKYTKFYTIYVVGHLYLTQITFKLKNIYLFCIYI